MDIDQWTQDLIQELNNLQKPMAKLFALLTKEHPGPKFLKEEYEAALKACALHYLDPKVQGLQKLLEDLKQVQSESD